MTQIVVDTDVVSFLFKNHPIGLRYDPELAGRVALISFMTVAEVERWTIQYHWGEHRLRWLHLHLAPVHGGAIQPGPLPQMGRSNGRRPGRWPPY